MKIVFHNAFLETYAVEPAAVPGRLEHSLSLLKERYPLVEPSPCSEEDVLTVHTPGHLGDIERDPEIYTMALLAAGAAIKAAELSLDREPSFTLCRPPGHHASPNYCWGFCYFNNVAIAVQKLLLQKKVQKVLIIDFDLHFGDGTANIFVGSPAVSYFHVKGKSSASFIKNLEDYLEKADADLIAVSAGFDRHREDWGGLLSTSDYGVLGKMLGSFAREKCGNRIFGVLEGGYNPTAMGDSLAAFLENL